MGCEDSLVSLMMFSSSSNSREKGVTYWKTSIPSSTLVTRWLQNQHENLPPWNQARSSPASAGRSLEGAVLFPHRQSSPWDDKVKLCKSWSLSHRVHVVVFGVPRKCRPLFHCTHLGSRLNNMEQRVPLSVRCKATSITLPASTVTWSGHSTLSFCVGVESTMSGTRGCQSWAQPAGRSDESLRRADINTLSTLSREEGVDGLSTVLSDNPKKLKSPFLPP